MKAYKGFDKDMTCREFQYKEGENYEVEKAELCESGFHACEYPLDCFSYYSPNQSEYHEVDLEGDIQKEDNKCVATKIHIGGRISIAGLVQAAIEFTMSKIKPEAKSNGYCGASSATGDCGASSATGDCGVSSATGNRGASSATGDYGASSATGYKGASSATGDYGASSATGNCGASSATGYKCSSEANDPCAIAVAWGYKGRAKGVKGARIVLADWTGNESKYWKENEWTLNGAKMIEIDGEKYKADTWYTMRDGEVVEWGNEDDL